VPALCINSDTWRLLLLWLGVQVDVFITPDGRVIKSMQLAGVVERQVPQKLVEHWNG
jgi:hypothetical protein